MKFELHDPSEYVIVNDDGYPSLQHFANPHEPENGTHIMFVEAGTTLEEIIDKAEQHQRGGR